MTKEAETEEAALPTHFLGVPLFEVYCFQPGTLRDDAKLTALESKCKSYKLYFSNKKYIGGEVFILDGTIRVFLHDVPDLNHAEVSIEKLVNRIRDDAHALVFTWTTAYSS